MTFKERIVAILLNTITGVQEEGLEFLLRQFKEHNPAEDYKDLLVSIHKAFKLLAKVAEGTPNRIDDSFVGSVVKVVRELAAADGITLE